MAAPFTRLRAVHRIEPYGNYATCPEYMAGDAKKKAAAWGNTAALGTLTNAARSEGYGDGESSGFKLMRTPENGFQRSGSAVAIFFVVYVFF